jgi:hypothetical protein
MDESGKGSVRWARLALMSVLGFFGGAACYYVARWFVLGALELYDEEVGPRLPWAALCGACGAAMYLIAEWRRG